MGASTSTLNTETIERLHRETGFTPGQLKKLYNRFQRLDKDHSGSITAEDFMSIPELAMNPLVERIIKIFDRNNADSDVEVNFDQFVKTLAVFLPLKPHHDPHMSKEEQSAIIEERRQKKIEFVFQIYDLNDDGMIDADELFKVLKMMVTNNISEEQLQFIVDQTIAEADADGDGQIGLEEFTKVLSHTDMDSRMTIRF